jgi:phosphoethanolamine N-methyltransferase
MPTINPSNEEYQLSAENNQTCGQANEVRDRMKDYWVKHSQLASIQEMLLDSNAEEISDQEMPEILSMLPTFKGKKVLELGAGIGRFTNLLAKQADSVIAVDFIEKFIKKNEEINSHLNNIEFVHGDVTKLAFETNAFHIIFSNWLLMYLNDEEVLKLFEKSLRSLKEGGYFFFRESCFHASGNIKKCDNNENPTEYRSPAKYIDFIQSRTIEENESQYGFELVLARPNRTYIEVNFDQIAYHFYISY